MAAYNVVVIGGGSAGLMVAAGCAGLGAHVALVEAHQMGGDCLNTGCIPSKALIRSAAVARLKVQAEAAVPAAAAQPEWSAVAARVQGVIAALTPHDSVERFQSLGVDVHLGRARLLSATRVEVSGPGKAVQLEGRALVLATGSRPGAPPIPGLREAGYVTNETVFAMPDLPRRLLVLGGGPIGLELGQALARLGSQVTVAEALPRLLPREDADAAAVVRQALEEDGLTLLTATRVTGVQGGPAGKRVLLEPAGAPPLTLEVDEILVATGRRPNVEDLGLEQAGVAAQAGGVQVDARMRTTAPSVYACGDVAGPYLFTHMANQQARVVIQNALLPVKARMDYRAVPWCTFTDPEVARVGLNEQDAAQRGVACRVLRVDLAEIDRAVCDGVTRGFLKILTPPGSDVILGATLVGPHAGELIHELIVAMGAGWRLRNLANTVHIYPTLAEVFRRAGDESRKAGFTPTLQALLKGYLRWRRE